MSMTFVFTGESSNLSYNFNPPIYLEDDIDYEIGLTNFESFNNIPTIDKTNNTFKWGEKYEHTVEIPEGAYNIDDITTYMTNAIMEKDEDAFIRISTDTNTSKVIIRTNRKITFDVDNSIGPTLGFKKRELHVNDNNISDDIVRMIKVNAICVDCSLTGSSSSFLNGLPSHIIHQFFPTVPVGYKIVESPLNIIYFPISVKTINNITVKVIDQDGRIVNFRGETITIRLHLRKTRF